MLNIFSFVDLAYSKGASSGRYFHFLVFFLYACCGTTYRLGEAWLHVDKS